MLELRIATALVLGSLLIAIILLGPAWLFSVFLVLCIFVAAWEWAGLSGSNHTLAKSVYGMTLIIIMILTSYFGTHLLINTVVILGVAWWSLVFFMVIAYQRGKHVLKANVTLKLVYGFLVLIPSSVSLLVLFRGQNGAEILLSLFILIWLVDSAAYFSGRIFGKHKLASRVSPGKTREGVIGSLVAAVLMAIACGLLREDMTISIIALVAIFLVTAIFSVTGDLFESMMKREQGVKDSGRILPGHGGVMDRIDSLTAAAPVFVLGLTLIGARS